jgi:hypothetical protein
MPGTELGSEIRTLTRDFATGHPRSMASSVSAGRGADGPGPTGRILLRPHHPTWACVAGRPLLQPLSDLAGVLMEQGQRARIRWEPAAMLHVTAAGPSSGGRPRTARRPLSQGESSQRQYLHMTSCVSRAGSRYGSICYFVTRKGPAVYKLYNPG